MFYWLVFILAIGSMFFVKRDAKFFLFAAFYIFCAGVILRMISLNEISEISMRISFIIWIIGLFKAFKEINE